MIHVLVSAPPDRIGNLALDDDPNAALTPGLVDAVADFVAAVAAGR
jgi:hypothetical protein